MEHKAGYDATVSVRVTNSGKRAGAEVVQLYLGFPSEAAEPPRQLKGFARVDLKPGESKTVTMTIEQKLARRLGRKRSRLEGLSGQIHCRGGSVVARHPLHRIVHNSEVKPPRIDSEQIRELGPPCYETVARAEWTDRNDHVNIRYFVAVFDDAGDAFYPTIGLGDADHRSRESGTMDLEHHIHFVREVRAGDRLAVYMRIVGVSAKRFHYLMFLWNESTGRLASIFECVNTFVDLARRKSAPWPEDVRAALQSLLDRDGALQWLRARLRIDERLRQGGRRSKTSTRAKIAPHTTPGPS